MIVSSGSCRIKPGDGHSPPAGSVLSAVDHQMRLGGGDNDVVAGLRKAVRVQPAGLHQNVGDTGGLNNMPPSGTIIRIFFMSQYLYHKISQAEGEHCRRDK